MNENLKISAALLSRFDLVFILLDKPDELLDKRVSEHIMSVSYPFKAMETRGTFEMIDASRYFSFVRWVTEGCEKPGCLLCSFILGLESIHQWPKNHEEEVLLFLHIISYISWVG